MSVSLVLLLLSMCLVRSFSFSSESVDNSLTSPTTILSTGGLTLELWNSTFTLKALNKTVHGAFDTTNNFSFVPEQAPRQGCHNLGDITVRIRPSREGGVFSYYSSASDVQAVPVDTSGAELLAHDITAALNATDLAHPDSASQRWNIPSKVASSSPSTSPSAGFTGNGTWATVLDKGLTCSSQEYKGELGTTANYSSCLAKVKTDLSVNYAIWRGDGNGGCYVCDLRDRGDPDSWQLGDMKGVASFIGRNVLPPPPAPPHFPGGVPLRVIRSYAAAASDAGGFILRFNLTNIYNETLEIGGLGMALPAAGMQPTIEQSVWNDPHIGLDHGFVEWARVVVDEQVMLAVPTEPDEGFEAWRPVMENTCGSEVWEFDSHSKAWALEWAHNQQYPYYYMDGTLNSTGTWPNPKSPWPAWHAHDTVPITNFTGMAQPWNSPTSKWLQPQETMSVALHVALAERGPRTRDAALQSMGKVSLHAVPGYVLSPQLQTASIYVGMPDPVLSVTSVETSNPAVVTAHLLEDQYLKGITALGPTVVRVKGVSSGRARVVIHLSDGTNATAHLAVVEGSSFSDVKTRLGAHWANDAWLPRDFVDPFGRSASVMPWDRENKQHVLDDSRAYDVGLSDDAGGGNPLGFAMKVGHSPVASEVERLDDYIRWTLYGTKEDTAKPPYKSLQLRPEDGGDTDGIRMTMYYYDNAATPSANYSGHFPYDYKEQDKCGHPGIEGGPNWCMSESNANATYRSFNYPHHCASYYAMYRVARYHTGIPVQRSWQWYLGRALNTTLKFGAPTTGVMDGSLFREILRSLEEEASVDGATWAAGAAAVRTNMNQRANHFASQEYPYGSEYAFDTTGQEEVVVWLSYFANASNGFSQAAQRTVDHILSYMRASATWAYNGGTRSWGDLGNNGKWMVSSGTASNFQTRGNMHYRAGLNAIPLFEWYRQHPDDSLLLEIAMGAQVGQLMNVDATGAPSMMLHMLPHILDYDPHSGDFGLGFYGHTLEAASYLVAHPIYGTVCFLCDIDPGLDTTSTEPLILPKQSQPDVVVYYPRDSYRIRTFIEPLGLYLVLDTGLFETVRLDLAHRELTLVFEQVSPVISTFSIRRLRVQKETNARPGENFKLSQPAGAKLVRGAYEFTTNETVAVITWS